MISRERVEEQLAALREQEAALRAEVEGLREQWLATLGAVQVCEKLLGMDVGGTDEAATV